MNQTNAIRNHFFYLLIIAAGVFAAYHHVLFADFISWDDADFTINNKDVKTFDIPALFSHFYLGNYAPFTMLSFSFDYYLAKESTWIYHFHNIILHATVSILVFFLFLKLFSKPHVALATALIFAVHPMQTESVSWVSERKNLVCALYYIISLMLYVNYVRHQNVKNYALVAGAFVCALLSKGMAVSLPFSLLAIDIWINRPFSKKLLTEKIPFFILSFIFGIIAINAQSYSGFLKVDHSFSFIQKILFSGYAFMQYAVKIIFPSGLSAIYPYPKVDFSLLFALGLLLFVAALCLIFITLKKDKKMIAGGLVFFIGNIIFVLQFISSGAVLMADHYVYIASLGFIFPCSVFIFSRFQNSKTPQLILSFLVILLLIVTHKRNETWKNNLVFWEDITRKYPNSEVALSSLGSEYMLKGNDPKAFEFLNRAILLNPNYLKAYYNRGLLYAKNNRFENAIGDFTKATEQKNYFKAYLSRAEAFCALKDYPKAISDIQIVLSSEQNNLKANYLAGNCYSDLNQLTIAIGYYNKCVNLNPREPLFYFRRAIVFGKLQKFQECLNDLINCTNLNPDFAEAYYWKGVAKVNLKQNPCDDFQKAMSLGYEMARNPFLKYCR